MMNHPCAGARRRELISSAFAPLVLVVVAVVHLVFVHRNELSRWKGGGFGMFSTIESPSNRIVTCELLKRSAEGVEDFEAGKVQLPKTEPVKEAVRRIKAVPSETAGLELANYLNALHWFTGSDTGDSSVDGLGAKAVHLTDVVAMRVNARAVTQDAVRVSVWRLRWNFEKMKVGRELITSVTSEVKSN